MNETIFVSGIFNVIQSGHLHLLRHANELGDRLIVGVQSDRLSGEAAHIPERFRLDGVRSNSFVSEYSSLADKPESTT
jgi:cytidyltransferase-like protein